MPRGTLRKRWRRASVTALPVGRIMTEVAVERAKAGRREAVGAEEREGEEGGRRMVAVER